MTLVHKSPSVSLERLLAEQQRTNELLQALVDMHSAELVSEGYPAHPLASPHR